MTSLSPYVVTLASGSRASAETETFDLTTHGQHGLILVTDITAPADGFSTTVSVLGIDDASGKSWTILDGAELTVAGTQKLEVREGLDDVAGAVAASQLPGTLRISISHSDSTSITRTVGVQLVG